MDLKVGDRVRILSAPAGSDNSPATTDFYNRIVDRKRSVRINRIDKDGNPCFSVRLRIPFVTESGKRGLTIVYHSLEILKNENNWVKVKSRKS